MRKKEKKKKSNRSINTMTMLKTRFQARPLQNQGKLNDLASPEMLRS
jgi:hypothetical protein